MVGAFLIGFLLKTSLWFLIPILLFFYYTTTALLEQLGYLIFTYREIHPPKPSTPTRCALFLLIYLPLTLLTILILTYLIL